MTTSYDIWFLSGPVPADDDWRPVVDAMLDHPNEPALVAAGPDVVARVLTIVPDPLSVGDELALDDAGPAITLRGRVDDPTDLAAVVAAIEEMTGRVAYDPQGDRHWRPEP